MTPQQTNQQNQQSDFKEAEDIIKSSLASMKQENHVEYTDRYRSIGNSKDAKWITKLQRWLGFNR